MITAWFASRVRLRRAEHDRVPDERRVRVDQAQDVRPRLERVGPEQDPRHLDRVLGALRMGHRAHERLVRVPHVRVDHVVVPLVHRKVDRLAHRAARVVQERRRVRELHEVAEVLDRAVAAATVEVADERRAVRRREHGRRAPQVDGVRRVAGDLVELARRRRLDELAGETREGTGPARRRRRSRRRSEQLERVGRLAEVDADLLEDRVGVVLDRLEALLGQDLDRRQRAGDEGDPLGDRGEAGGARGPPGRRCDAGAALPRAWLRCRRSCAAPLVVVVRRRRRGRSPDVTVRGRAGRRRRPAAGTGRWRAGSPSPRRSAPGSAAPPRSRASRRVGRRPRSRRALRGSAARSGRRCRRRSRRS